MIKGRNIDKDVLVVGNKTVFDLSGSAAQETVLFHGSEQITINKIWVTYEETTSSDAGVTVKIGKTGTLDAYFSATTEVSKTAPYTKEYGTGDMTLATVPAATPIIVASAGSKVGTGTCYVWFSYTIGPN